MSATISKTTTVVPYAKAMEIAASNNRTDDSGWQYIAIPCKAQDGSPNGFGFVEVYDEDGRLVGTL